MVEDATSKARIKLIVTMTNKRANHGGVNIYATSLGGRYHNDMS